MAIGNIILDVIVRLMATGGRQLFCQQTIKLKTLNNKLLALQRQHYKSVQACLVLTTATGRGKMYGLGTGQLANLPDNNVFILEALDHYN